MTLVSGSMVFFITWWVVLFMVLPFGVHMEEDPPKGFASSAPKNPYLKKKFLITTLLSIIVWCIIQVVIMNRWISLS